MIDSRWTHQDELVDILLDLKHDLGKYLFLHLSHLTSDSPQDMIEEALHTALFETRKIGGKVQPAKDIWEQYRKEIEALDYAFDGYHRLIESVENALKMASFLDDSTISQPLHVGQIQKIARQVSENISQIISEESGDQ